MISQPFPAVALEAVRRIESDDRVVDEVTSVHFS